MSLLKEINTTSMYSQGAYAAGKPLYTRFVVWYLS